MNKGDYIKAYGADWGAYWNGSRWIRFECLGCAYALGLLPGNRLQQANHLRVRIGSNNVVKHDAARHNNWLAQGKPTKGDV